ncbi:MAG: hypothetical protein RML12_02250 [Xanthomonadales bacterium]|nr:hypothetical protein [Xanthomonadales bacterium]
MAAARSVPPFLPLALGTVAAGCAPLAPPPFAAALLLLAAGLGLAAPSLDRASPRRALAGLGSSLLVLAILMAPFLPALAAAKGLLAAAPEPRALLWLTALLALLLGGCWLLAPAPVLAVERGCAVAGGGRGAALARRNPRPGRGPPGRAVPAGPRLRGGRAGGARRGASYRSAWRPSRSPLPVVAWLLARRIAGPRAGAASGTSPTAGRGGRPEADRRSRGAALRGGAPRAGGRGARPARGGRRRARPAASRRARPAQPDADRGDAPGPAPAQGADRARALGQRGARRAHAADLPRCGTAARVGSRR